MASLRAPEPGERGAVVLVGMALAVGPMILGLRRRSTRSAISSSTSTDPVSDPFGG
ncbi:hypothetical protein [Actinospongicola halichondriae]|uniref:hypothetical protein n=1 Tax=Actinospongicola halichondriae TaxID=3236844 RepID=UPI003D508830